MILLLSHPSTGHAAPEALPRKILMCSAAERGVTRGVVRHVEAARDLEVRKLLGLGLEGLDALAVCRSLRALSIENYGRALRLDQSPSTFL